MTIFSHSSLDDFSRNYPEVAHKIAHNLLEHPLLTLESISRLANATLMKDRECNIGNVPIGLDGRPEQMIENLGDRVLNLADEDSGSVFAISRTTPPTGR